LLKSLCIVLLAALVSFSGVASAFADCLTDTVVGREHRHAREQGPVKSSAAQVSSSVIAPNLPSRQAEKIHCFEPHDRTELIMVPASVLRLTRSVDGVLLNSSLASGLSSSGGVKAKGLSFGWPSPAAPVASSSLYLILSVLNI
jgi:hypothetical protein